MNLPTIALAASLPIGVAALVLMWASILAGVMQ